LVIVFIGHGSNRSRNFADARADRRAPARARGVSVFFRGGLGSVFLFRVWRERRKSSERLGSKRRKTSRADSNILLTSSASITGASSPRSRSSLDPSDVGTLEARCASASRARASARLPVMNAGIV
jgi:hypothetical protein